MTQAAQSTGTTTDLQQHKLQGKDIVVAAGEKCNQTPPAAANESNVSLNQVFGLLGSDNPVTMAFY